MFKALHMYCVLCTVYYTLIKLNKTLKKAAASTSKLNIISRLAEDRVPNFVQRKENAPPLPSLTHEQK